VRMEPLPYTAEIAAETAPLYRRVSHVVPELEWPVFAPYVSAINRLKRQRRAVVLAHNYMTPEIFHCVADFVGDSLQLAREAAKTDARIIVQAGVHFMAETAKILSPQKTVLIPDTQAGCSLAASITSADVRLLRQNYPGIPIITYVNTSAEVKAESDICCTSSNAVEVVEAIAAEFGVDTVIMIPDEYLAQNTAKQTSIKIITWKGHCEVHERFSAEDVRGLRAANPGLVVLAHPECPPEVIAEADFAGSTSGMIAYVGKHRPARVVLMTECSMSDNVAVEYPGVSFVRPCNLCPHMKRITLPKLLHSLETMTTEVVVEPLIAARARTAVDAMLRVKPKRQRQRAAA
jgi:quinolinate synthase